MSPPGSPRHVVEALIQGITEERWNELDRLYAEDAVVEYPLALPMPMTLNGRKAIHTYFEAAATSPLKLRATNMVIRETADPEVVVAQWDYDGVVMTTGQPFRVSNIQVSTIREGRIVASRDYHNHLVLAQATGRLPAVLRAMVDDTPS